MRWLIYHHPSWPVSSMVFDYHREGLNREGAAPTSMVERQLLLVICACITIAGTLAMAAWLAWEPPAKTEIEDLEDVELGQLVIVEGTVEGTPVEGGDVSVVLLGEGLTAR